MNGVTLARQKIVEACDVWGLVSYKYFKDFVRAQIMLSAETIFVIIEYAGPLQESTFGGSVVYGYSFVVEIYSGSDEMVKDTVANLGGTIEKNGALVTGGGENEPREVHSKKTKIILYSETLDVNVQ